MNKTMSALILTLAVAGLVGCSHAGRVDQHFGEAYHEAIVRSTDDPEGSAANADQPAPSGTDGVTASQAIGRHRQGLQPGGAPTLPLPMIVTGSESLGSN
jgi:hypothetical protein